MATHARNFLDCFVIKDHVDYSMGSTQLNLGRMNKLYLHSVMIALMTLQSYFSSKIIIILF